MIIILITHINKRDLLNCIMEASVAGYTPTPGYLCTYTLTSILKFNVQL